MPIILQHRIYRVDLRNNPEIMYLFGDNELREGMGGQAHEMRGEGNAIGIRTKRFPSLSPEAFWTDETFDSNYRMMQNDFKPVIIHLNARGSVIIPSDGLGTGLSRLPETAPKTFSALEEIIRSLREFN